MCVEPWEQLVLAGAALDAQLHQLLWHIRILSGAAGEEEAAVSCVVILYHGGNGQHSVESRPAHASLPLHTLFRSQPLHRTCRTSQHAVAADGIPHILWVDVDWIPCW